MILPDGVTIHGHKRRRAVALLEWQDVEVFVRHDLADDPAAAERELIGDNLVRRQLGKMALARLYSRLIEITPFQSLDPFDKRPRVNLKEQLANRLDCSPRNLNRYIAVSRAPLEVQQAFDDERLSLTLAARVAAMPTEQQELIADALRDGGDATQVVTSHIESGDTQVKSPVTAYRRLLQQLQQATAELEGNTAPISGKLPFDRVSVLTRGQALIASLLKRERARDHDDGLGGQRLNKVVDGLKRSRGRRG